MVKKNNNGRERYGRWKSLEFTIEQVRRIMKLHSFDKLPSDRILRELSCGGLSIAINKYHGGFPNFRKVIGEEIQDWKSFSYAKKQVEKLKKDHNLEILPQENKLREMGYGGLASAIRRYQGGYVKFRKKLGEKRRKSLRDLSFALEQARKIIEEHNLDRLPNSEVLYSLKCGGLVNAINRYYGGFVKFRKKLGEEKEENSHRLRDTIKQAEEIIKKHNLSRLPNNKWLVENGYSKVANLIKEYHGGYVSFRKALGEEIPDQRRWQSLEYIIQQANKVKEKYHFKRLPCETVLRRLGNGELANAIRCYHMDFPNFRKVMGEFKDWKNVNYVIEKAKEVIKKHKLKKLPMEPELSKLGYGDLAYAIHAHHGGFPLFRKLLNEDNPWKKSDYILEEAKRVKEENGFEVLPGYAKLCRLGYNELANSIMKYPGRFPSFRKLLNERQYIDSESKLRDFLKENKPARNIVSLAATNGYASDVADILVKLWPDRFPSASKLARSLPGAIIGIGDALKPFHLEKNGGLWDDLPSLPKEVKYDLEDLLYRVVCDQYQTQFNQNPRKTLAEIKQFSKDKRIEGLASRVLEYYKEIYSFNIPGHGRIGDYN